MIHYYLSVCLSVYVSVSVCLPVICLSTHLPINTYLEAFMSLLNRFHGDNLHCVEKFCISPYFIWEVVNIFISLPKRAQRILAYFRARTASEFCWIPVPGPYPSKWRKQTCPLLWGIMKLIWYARITYRHAVRAPQLWWKHPMSQIPGPLLLFETVAFTKKLKIIPTSAQLKFSITTEYI